MQNKALRAVLNAYDRTHISDLHRFCGIWKLETLHKYRRLNSLARWMLLPNEHPMKHALIVSEREELPWFVHSVQTIDSLGLRTRWNSFLNALEQPSKKIRYEALHSWKLTLRTTLNANEARPYLKLTPIPHPSLCSPFGNIVFLFTQDSFNPVDKVERNGGQFRCWICKSRNCLDTPHHLLHICKAGVVKAWRIKFQDYAAFFDNIYDWQSTNEKMDYYANTERVLLLSSALHELYSVRKTNRDEKNHKGVGL